MKNIILVVISLQTFLLCFNVQSQHRFRYDGSNIPFMQVPINIVRIPINCIPLPDMRVIMVDLQLARTGFAKVRSYIPIGNFQPLSTNNLDTIPRNGIGSPWVGLSLVSTDMKYKGNVIYYNTTGYDSIFYIANYAGIKILGNTRTSYSGIRLPIYRSSNFLLSRTVRNDSIIAIGSEVTRLYANGNRLYADTLVKVSQIIEADSFIRGSNQYSYFQSNISQMNSGAYVYSNGLFGPAKVYGRGIRRKGPTSFLRFRLSGDTVVYGQKVFSCSTHHWVVAEDSIRSTIINNLTRGAYFLRLENDGSFRKISNIIVKNNLPVHVDRGGGLWFISYVNPDTGFYYLSPRGAIRNFNTPEARKLLFGFSIGPDGTKWYSANAGTQATTALYALRDIDPRPRSFYDSLGRTRPGTRGRDTLFATSAIPNIRLQDSSTSITLGVERVRWVFPAGSGIRAGDTAVGRSVNIAVPRPGRYRVRVRVWDTTQAYSDTSFYITIRGQVQAIDESLFAGTPLIAQPNPTTGQLTITGLAPGIPITLYSASGKLLWQKEPPASTQAQSQPQPNPSEINLTAYPPGLYLLRQGQRTVRVVWE
jgi:hypothetical protein